VIVFLRQLVLKDTLLKLFSLALAFLIWYIVASAIEQQGSPVKNFSLLNERRTFYNLPILVLSAAEDVRSFKVSPGEVAVTVEGDPQRVGKLQSADIRALVDLTGIEAGHGLRKRIEVSTPPGVTHVLIEPPEVEVVLPPKG
jgi:YbbR domain-containing protein